MLDDDDENRYKEEVSQRSSKSLGWEVVGDFLREFWMGLGEVLGCLGEVLGGVGGVLERSWKGLGGVLGVLEALKTALNPSWAPRPT